MKKKIHSVKKDNLCAILKPKISDLKKRVIASIYSCFYWADMKKFQAVVKVFFENSVKLRKNIRFVNDLLTLFIDDKILFYWVM